MGLSVQQMQLEPDVAAHAEALKRAVPGVVFISGRRTLTEQSRAMAQNCAVKRSYIADVYAESPVKEALVAWLHAHPAATSVDALTAGFISVLQKFTPAQLAHLSKHMGGRAFDVHPHSCTVEQIEALHPVQFFTREANLEIWHVGF